MSIPSCSSAPNTGGMNPSAANTIATRLRPMPARTLWRAIASERLPMRTASATRSTRSTRMTASAVSGDRRSGGSHRDPDVGERERRRVVDPVADHHHRPEEPSAWKERTSSSFCSGVCSA